MGDNGFSLAKRASKFRNVKGDTALDIYRGIVLNQKEYKIAFK